MDSAQHVPVLLERVLALLAPAVAAVHDAVVVDCTLGLGGHTEAMLETFPDVRVVGIDRDQQALDRAARRLARFGDRVTFVHAVYDRIGEVVQELDPSGQGARGILFDLGVSSMQLDHADRGFAYSRPAPLDMRMDQESGPSAADVLNTWPQHELTRILQVYGEEKFARQIARAIVADRTEHPFESSEQLVALLERVIPAPARRTGGHPAKRTFQALRIAVNDELEVYRRALPAALGVTAVGGRVVVLSYHSLEDRITKREFAAVTSEQVPTGVPVVPQEYLPRFRLLTRGSEKASPVESEQNPRARSVRCRAVERVRAGAVS